MLLVNQGVPIKPALYCMIYGGLGIDLLDNIVQEAGDRDLSPRTDIRVLASGSHLAYFLLSAASGRFQSFLLLASF